MLVAIASSASDSDATNSVAMDSRVDPRFGRAGCFVVYDTNDESRTIIDNDQDLQAIHGAGIQAAQKVVDRGAQAVIAGSCGPKAFAVLDAAGVAVYLLDSGTVHEAIARFVRGELKQTLGPSVEAGHGSI